MYAFKKLEKVQKNILSVKIGEVTEKLKELTMDYMYKGKM